MTACPVYAGARSGGPARFGSFRRIRAQTTSFGYWWSPWSRLNYSEARGPRDRARYTANRSGGAGPGPRHSRAKPRRPWRQRALARRPGPPRSARARRARGTGPAGRPPRAGLDPADHLRPDRGRRAHAVAGLALGADRGRPGRHCRHRLPVQGHVADPGRRARPFRAAAHPAPAGHAAAVRLPGPARAGHPRYRLDHRSPGHRPGRGVRRGLRAVGPPSAGPHHGGRPEGQRRALPRPVQPVRRGWPTRAGRRPWRPA